MYIAKILVDSGPTLKRWLPRAMGRATPIMKRTCSIELVLGELVPGTKKAKKTRKPEVLKSEEALPVPPEKVGQIEEKPAPEAKPKLVTPARPFGASGQAKKRYFSRQTFGNIRKMFRRKSI
ncbi:MAG: 50S ribosomal protein L22 [Parcubacteria group bacterium LiPW_39]|nr:MAG: 50S ribosomal protein L22 [Parcubacteria group bacterium LiPW_39]